MIRELTKFVAVLNVFKNQVKKLISFCIGTIFVREFVDLSATVLRKITIPNGIEQSTA